MTVWFVTGTDTGVGKTIATAALAVTLQARGRRPFVIKPAQTGVAADEPGDLAEVQRLSGAPGHEGARLREPLAPDTAARIEGATLPPLTEQRDAILRAAEQHDDVVVEGSGGILVPLGVAWNLLDLAQTVAHAGAEVRFLVVARAGLGTLNHSGLTVDAIQRRELPVDGVVIGSWPEHPDLAAEQNLFDLPVITGVPVAGRIPEGAGVLSPEAFRDAAGTWLQLPEE